MRTLLRSFVVVATFTALIGSADKVAAQSQGASPNAQQNSMKSMGKLMSVDLDAKMFTITAADGSEQRFRYTDQTTILGAEQGVEGLARTGGGAPITVYFKTEGATNIATSVEVDQTQLHSD